MIILDELEMSWWAFRECYTDSKKDTPEIRSLITHDQYKYLYCLHINNIEEMWSKIKSRHWIERYNEYAKGRTPPKERRFII